jgi:hypothetical protein
MVQCKRATEIFAGAGLHVHELQPLRKKLCEWSKVPAILCNAVLQNFNVAATF